MGTITRALANNITTGGVVSASGISNTSVSAVTSLPAGAVGDFVLISEQTASADASLSFTSGIDSTYDVYCFKFINIHPSAYEELGFQGSTDGGSNYNSQITSTFFQAYNLENNTGQGISYLTGYDQANGTSFQRLNYSTYTDSDSNLCGELFLFNPSSTTYVKHFIARTSEHINNAASDAYAAGYFNTTSAINAVQFKMESGNIDAGTIKLFGVKKT